MADQVLHVVLSLNVLEESADLDDLILPRVTLPESLTIHRRRPMHHSLLRELLQQVLYDLWNSVEF